MKSIVILGAGGYAQELAWTIDDLNAVSPAWELLGFVDPGHPQGKGSVLYDRPILGGFEAKDLLPADVSFACGIGKPSARRKESMVAEKLGWRPATLIHPSVIVARHVEVGDGSVIGAYSVLAPYARIGRHCAINLHVTVGHNSSLADYCVLSPGVRVSGNAQLEEEVFVGSNASIYFGRRVGRGATLGANSFLVTDLAPGKSAFGIPARPFAQSTGAGICTTQENKPNLRPHSP